MNAKGRRTVLILGVLAVAVLGTATWLAWPQVRFRWLFEPLGRNAQGYPEYRHRRTGIVFVSLPGGKFWMGAQKTDPQGQNYDAEAEDAEGPVHEALLSPFLMGKFEVTQSQWQAVTGSNPSNHKGDDNRPVERITWRDVQDFARKTGLSLPTEAEWEYACRARTTDPFMNPKNVWLTGHETNDNTYAVGQKEANAFGLHDMIGNVWEWCEDVYDEGFYGKPEAREPDPVAKRGGEYRVFRGRVQNFDLCRPSYRGGCDDFDNLLGFRAAWRP